MVRDYIIRISQILIVTIFVSAFYLSYVDYFNVDFKDYTSLNDEYDIRIHVGRHAHAINKSKGDNTLLISSEKDLNLVETNKLSNEIFGNTILETENNSYVNNLEEVIVTDKNGKTKSYFSKLSQHSLDVIYSYPIEVEYSFEDSGVYHSLSTVYVETTIGYKVKSSLITQIDNGIRTDILIGYPIEQFVYDKESETYFMFFVPSTSKYADGVISQVEYVTATKKDRGVYVVDNNPKSAGFSATTGKIESISSVVGDKVLISYSKNVSYSDINQIHYYLGTFNVKTQTLEEEKVLLIKDNKLDSDIVVVDSLQMGEHLYVFYDDLSYFKFNIYDGSYENFIITNTGTINEFQFSSDGTNVFLLALGSKNVTLFELHDGIVQNSVSMTRRKLGMGLIDFNRLYDFSIKPTIKN